MHSRLFTLLAVLVLLAACQPAHPLNTAQEIPFAVPEATTVSIPADALPVVDDPLPLTDASATQPAPDICPLAGPEVEAAPTFAGTWINERGEVLILTGSTLYLRVWAGNDTTSYREIWADIQSIDQDNGTLKLRYRRIAVNGKNGGFDAPTHLARFILGGDQLSFAISPLEDEIPYDLKLITYTLKG